jgi:pSer/pThr/pTyr-binding forkhead associated (FHA) protein
MPRLVITKGAGVGRDVTLAGECVVGRATDADFVIDDTLASRRHIRVLKDAGAWTVEDLGSRNGTLVNGQRVQRQGLKDGDLLKVGGTELIFRDEGAAPAAPAAPAKGAVVVPAVAGKAPAAANPNTTAAPPQTPAKKPMPTVVPTPRRRL